LREYYREEKLKYLDNHSTWFREALALLKKGLAIMEYSQKYSESDEVGVIREAVLQETG
jgi:hypothetical protein